MSLELCKLLFFKNARDLILSGSMEFESKLDALIEEVKDRFDNLPRMLINANLSERMDTGETFLFFCTKEGRLDAIKFLLIRHFDPKAVSKTEDGKESCLSVACRYGFINIIDFFIRQKIFDELEIERCLKIEGLSKNVKKALKTTSQEKSCVCLVF